MHARSKRLDAYKAAGEALHDQTGSGWSAMRHGRGQVDSFSCLCTCRQGVWALYIPKYASHIEADRRAESPYISTAQEYMMRWLDASKGGRVC